MAGPAMSVIVLSYRSEETILDCVDSLLNQGDEIEVIVSHSGGPVPGVLAERPQVRVVAQEGRRMTGAARNAGVEASSAPIVAFLAADCLAAPGWVEGRLARHRARAEVVGTAVAPVETTAAARAMWLYEHGGRMAVSTPCLKVLHGCSYTRELIDRYGPFEDLELGEDTLFNKKLIEAGIEAVWAPEVVALHHYPTTVRGVLRDGFGRGARKVRARGPGYGFRNQAADPLRSLAKGIRCALRADSPVSRLHLAASVPIMAACGLALFCGLLTRG